MNEENLEIRLRDIENQLIDLKHQKEPGTLQYKLNYAYTAIEQIQKTLNEIEIFMDVLNSNDKYIEIFDPKELKRLYDKSEYSLPDLQSFLGRVTNNTAITLDECNTILGGVADMRVLSRLGKYLRMRVIHNANKALASV